MGHCIALIKSRVKLINDKSNTALFAGYLTRLYKLVFRFGRVNVNDCHGFYHVFEEQSN